MRYCLNNIMKGIGIMYILMLVLILTLASCSENLQKTPIKVIFETDMGNDIDDALALDMLYKYMDAGKAEILAIGVNKIGFGPVEFIDIMNTWYGYPEIPIGKITDGIDLNNPLRNYSAKVAVMTDQEGVPLFETSHSGDSYSELPETHELYRQILSEQADNSVTIISVGFSTNLVRLLESTPDKWSELSGSELIAKKVRLLSIMAGDFRPDAIAEFNVVKDIPAAQLIMEHWPSAVTVSPFDVGLSILYPATSIENDFGWALEHPLVEAYKAWNQMPYDRPTWDLTSVLYAVEGGKWFTVSPNGEITVDDEGYTHFKPCEDGNRSYLSVTDEQSKSILQHFLKIITSSPANRTPAE